MWVGEWWPPEDEYYYCLFKISPNGNWLHKLYISGINLIKNTVFLLPNGDYLLIANASENPTGNGTIFFARMKPWNDSITGIEQQPYAVEQLSVYPNPANGFINLQLPKGPEGWLQITNLQGEVVHNQNIAQRQTSIKLNITRLEPGIYLVRHHTQKQVFIAKFLKL